MPFRGHPDCLADGSAVLAVPDVDFSACGLPDLLTESHVYSMHPPWMFESQPAYLCRGRLIMGRGILLWMLGVPIPIILLLAMCQH